MLLLSAPALGLLWPGSEPLNITGSFRLERECKVEVAGDCCFAAALTSLN